MGDEDLSVQYDLYEEFDTGALNKSIYFYDINLEWNQENTSIMSNKLLGLGNINEFQINKYYKGRLELNKDYSGDILNLIIEIVL